ncbi:hypothetical protein MPSEU_000752700 [Mayamaea pseudoterrestris]|nr:hypothetical protein MPSEU_000752700 [Mayamaea pseudoterrestris]
MQMQILMNPKGGGGDLAASLRGDRSALRPKQPQQPQQPFGSTSDQTVSTAGNKTKRTTESSSNEIPSHEDHNIPVTMPSAGAAPTAAAAHTITHHVPTKTQAALILSNTRLVLKDLQHKSSFFQRNPKRILPSFEPSDVEVGEFLGIGEFGVVLSIQKLIVPLIEHEQLLLQGKQAENKGKTEHVNDKQPMSLSLAKDPKTPDDSLSLPKSIIVPSHIIKKQKKQDNPTAPHQRQSSKSLVELEALMAASQEPGDVTNLYMENEGEAEQQARYGTHAVPGDTHQPHHHTIDDNDAQQEHEDDHDSLDSAITSSTTNQKQQVAAVLEKTKHCLSEHVHREGMARYALKRLRVPKMDNNSRSPNDQQRHYQKQHDQHIMNAAIDLACEATFLASLAHSNIVRLRATVGTIGQVNFCIIMDRLTDTLEDRMVTWVARSVQCRPRGLVGCGLALLSKRSRKNKMQAWQQLYADRLLAAFDIARAIRYLHAHKIIYRDLKPDNVGFDVRGNVRIFDFGLAKELKKHDLVEPPDKYDATGLTGSRRFMSPECIKCLPYGFSADVYSYSILFWQIFALQVPFPNNNVRKHYEQVVLKQQRPNKHAAKVSPMLMNMMTSAWDDDPSKRPLFKQICQQLQVEILDVTADGAGGASIVDRSTHLMNRSLNSLYNNAAQRDSHEEEDDYE